MNGLVWGWGAQTRGSSCFRATLSLSLPICKARREAQPSCLDPCPCSQSWAAVEVPCAGTEGRSRSGAAVLGGGCLGPSAAGRQAKSRGAVEVLLWREDRSLSWALPRFLVLGLHQPRGCLRSYLGVQGPESCRRRHRGDHLSPPGFGLCDECAGHLEEVGS